jgi:azurin
MRTLATCLALVAALALPAAAAEVIKIGTLPGLRFDVSAFSVRPGAEVELVFTNSDDMQHNLVITRPGMRMAVVENVLTNSAGLADRDYVPATPDVLWATKVVGSNQSFTLKFTAPTVVAEYPYVCTFPGHGLIMFGSMVVTNNPQPPVQTPKDLPGVAAMPAMDHAAHMAHAAAATRASVKRFFMGNAGPASIAVELPGGYSYCWDAGAGRFRYAWKGMLGERPERGVAKIEGEVYYREEGAGFPIRVGPDPSVEPKKIDFQGYTLDAQGIPEFELTLDGVTVYERVEIKDGRIARRFRTNGNAVWFSVAAAEQERFSATGPKEGAFYKFTGNAAKEFTVTYTPAAK